jgi:hypothetical protein
VEVEGRSSLHECCLQTAFLFIGLIAFKGYTPQNCHIIIIITPLLFYSGSIANLSSRRPTHFIFVFSYIIYQRRRRHSLQASLGLQPDFVPVHVEHEQLV